MDASFLNGTADKIHLHVSEKQGVYDTFDLITQNIHIVYYTNRTI